MTDADLESLLGHRVHVLIGLDQPQQETAASSTAARFRVVHGYVDEFARVGDIAANAGLRGGGGRRMLYRMIVAPSVEMMSHRSVCVPSVG